MGEKDEGVIRRRDEAFARRLIDGNLFGVAAAVAAAAISVDFFGGGCGVRLILLE